ncbi:MAG: hypothetical protein GX944_01070 [Alphaproteobacteria bacterium]|nr:hypothetical protein [Alphaproteobacteria bacterium]
MRVLISVAIISAIFGADALAANIAPNGRSRPGSVKGAIISNQAKNAVQGPYTTQGLDVNNCPGCRAAPHNNPMDIPQSDDDSTCGEILPALGVDACVAKKACSGITVDGHSGIFDEATATCKIPVCAHNWSGIIKKDTEDVCAYVDMNKVITCNADLFEQIDSMRRTSQWVVPLAVAGGAGIGTGVGALIDNKQNKKAEELAKIADGAQSGFSGVIEFNGGKYKLPEEADKLKAAIKGHANLKGKMTKVNTLIDECAKSMFVDLTSQTVNGAQKWGRIKLTDSDTNCKSDVHDDNVKYCQFQNMHSQINKLADCAKTAFTDAGFKDDYIKTVKSTNPSNSYLKSFGSWTRNATCYFRDSLGSGEAHVSATIQSDQATIEFLKNYIQKFNNSTDTNRKELVDKLNKFEFESNFSTSGVSNATGDIINYVVVKSKDANTTQFSSIIGGKCDAQELNNIFNDTTSGSMTGASANNILLEAFGALTALNSINNLDSELEDLFNTLIMSDDILEIQGLGSKIREYFGADRPFFKTAKGRGLLIGSGVGAVAGLGYWFAEGAGTFCDVGGLEQVKLKKSYSIPSFRDYLINKGFIK